MTAPAWYGYRRLANALLAALLLIAPIGADAAGFVIRNAELALAGNLYQVNANVRFELSETTLEAVQSGVPLVFNVRAELLRPRDWWWDERLARAERSLQLQFHALSGRYLVEDLDSGARQSFATLSDALFALGTVRDLVLIEAGRLRSGESYLVRVRADLDIESLPTPVRLWAYVSSDWRLHSGWYQWQLEL